MSENVLRDIVGIGREDFFYLRLMVLFPVSEYFSGIGLMLAIYQGMMSGTKQ